MGTGRKSGADVGEGGAKWAKWVPDDVLTESVRIRATFVVMVFLAGVALGLGVMLKLRRPLPPPHYGVR